MSTTNHGAGIPAPSPARRPIADGAASAEKMKRELEHAARLEFYTGTPDAPKLLAMLEPVRTYERPLGAMSAVERAAYFDAGRPHKVDERTLGDAVLAMRETCDGVLEHYTGTVAAGTDLEAVRVAFLRLGALLGYDVAARP